MKRPNALNGLPAIRQAVLYARVSSREQEAEGYSLAAQVKLLRDYATLHGIKVLEEFIDVETAKRTGREEFGKMLSFLKRSRKCRVVLAEKTDRLYRNLKDWVTIDDLGLELHLVKENVILAHDARSSEKFMHGIRVLMAKNYIDNLSEEVTKGMVEKAEQGMWPSFAPLGYRNVAVPGEQDSRKMIEPDPDRAPLVVQLFEWYATGDYSIKELGRMAKDSGLTFRKSGALIPTSTVHRILRQRIYTGDFEWHGRVHRGTYEALISRELWECVQDVLDGRNAKRPKRRRHQFAFSGLIHCGHCGCSMVGELQSGQLGRGQYVYYHCTGNKGRCPERYTREEVIVAQFTEQLRRLRFDPPVLEWITSALRQSHQDERRFHDQAISRLQAEYVQLQHRLDTMYIDKLDGTITSAYYDRRSAEFRADQVRIQTALTDHQSANQSYLDLGIQLVELASQAADLFERQPSDARRDLLKFVVSNCTWQEGRLAVSYRPPFDLILETAEATARNDRGDPGDGPSEGQIEIWSGARDSNPGPHGPEPCSAAPRRSLPLLILPRLNSRRGCGAPHRCPACPAPP
jgi:site-specific DNA recombinase